MKSLLVAFTCLWGTTVLACACTCKGEKTVERAFQYHESIVHGKVLSITMVSKASTMNEKKRDSLLSTLDTSSNHYRSLHNKGTLRVEVAVITRFKGTSNSEVIIIHASPHGAACGYARFEIDQEFLIYGSSKSYQFLSFQPKGPYIEYEKENTFWTSHCYRTKKYLASEAQELTTLMNKR